MIQKCQQPTYLKCPKHEDEQLARVCLDQNCQSKPLVCFLCHQDHNQTHITKPLKKFLKELQSRRDDQPTNELARSSKAQLQELRKLLSMSVRGFREAVLEGIGELEVQLEAYYEQLQGRIDEEVGKYSTLAAQPFQYNTKNTELMADVSKQVLRLNALKKMAETLSVLMKNLIEKQVDLRQRIETQITNTSATVISKISGLRDMFFDGKRVATGTASPRQRSSDLLMLEEMRKRADKIKQQDRLASFRLAVRSYTQVIVTNSKDGASYFGRGSCHRELGDYDRAVADFSEAIKLEPSNSQYYANRAWALWLMGKFQPGLEDCDITLSIEPAHPWATALRGLLRVRLGLQAEGTEDLNQQDVHELACYFKGCAYRRMDEWQRAVSTFSEGLRIKQHWRLFNERGYCYSLMRKFELAIADYSKCIELDPTNALHFSNRAQALIEIGREQQAQADRRQAIALQQ